jgi:hypothetical protein
MFGAIPPKGLPKDIIGRMIAYRIQEEAFGGLDQETRKLLNRLAKGGKSNELGRRFKAGTVLVREYRRLAEARPLGAAIRVRVGGRGLPAGSDGRQC